MEIAIVGGGAAGFFAAITAKENYPDATVVIFEKSKEILAKVGIPVLLIDTVEDPAVQIRAIMGQAQGRQQAIAGRR